MKKRAFYLHVLNLCIAAGIALVSGAQEAQAGPIELSVDPAISRIASGQSFNIDIRIAGLEDEDLGAFEFDLSFDPTVVQYQSYILGAELADPSFGGFGDFSDVSSAGNGLLIFAESATQSELALADRQPDDFILASVSFLAQQPGISSLTLSNIELYDGSLSASRLQVSSVTDGSVTVPVPGTLLLMPFGLGLIAVRRFTAKG